MLNLDNIVSNKNENKNNDWPFRMLILGPSGCRKTNTLLHLTNDLHPIDKIYLYAKDTQEPKYEYLINKREQAGIKNFNDPHAFIEYSDDIYIYFSMWIFIHEHSRITGLQGKGEGISLTPHYHFHPPHGHLGISWAITAESSPLHIASNRTRTGNLWFPSASR